MSALVRVPLIFVVFALGACGMTTYFKAVSTDAVIAKGCRDELSVVHVKKADAAKAKAQAGDGVGAQADLDKWSPIYERLKTTCVALKAIAEEALVAAPVVEAAAKRDKEIAAWITRLTKAGLDTIAVLAEAGIRIPGVK